MSWPVLPHGLLGTQATALSGDSDTYQIERSLRFNSADSAYLDRTPASAGSQTKWTMSIWVKRSKLGAAQAIFSAGTSNITFVSFQADDTLRFRGTTVEYVTTQVFRDPSSWNHIVFVWDSSNATASNRLKIYNNGLEITSYSTQTTAGSSESTIWNSAVSNQIGRYAFNGTALADFYLTEINFIDGQALTPSSFGETDPITGRWKAKAYSGTYGTNGFYLKFADNSGTTSTTLGKDSSGNGNNWTPNNFSVTEGVGNDSLTDTPTNYGALSNVFTDDTYQIERSLRFNSADSAYLSRTPASAGNRKTWTWSGWVKRSKIGAQDFIIFNEGGLSSNYVVARFASGGSGDNIEFFGSAGAFNKTTSNLFRDPSAWYHFVFVMDATNSQARIYVNGVEATYSTNTNPSNADQNFNRAQEVNIGRATSNTQHFDGYITEINFIDGQALTPDSFGERESGTYLWKPKAYTGSYGTNGFYLKFSDNSSLTTTSNVGIGKDFSGNTNYWATNGISINAGADNDSLTDTPTYYGTDAGAGGEARGNYATLNPLQLTNSATAPSNGNLTSTANTGAWRRIGCTRQLPTSGKWYFEYSCDSFSTFATFSIGVFSGNLDTGNNDPGYLATEWVYYASGYATNNNISISSGFTSATTGDVLQLAYDADTGKIWFGKNNTWQGTGSPNPATGASATYSGVYNVTPLIVQNWATQSVNFGQRPFAYAAPTGFKALRDYNKTSVPVGGVVRGNYCTLNPLGPKVGLAPTSSGYGIAGAKDGNLVAYAEAGGSALWISATQAMTTGKWYWEQTLNDATYAHDGVGIKEVEVQQNTTNYYWLQTIDGFFVFKNNGDKKTSSTSTSISSSLSAGNVVGVAFDADNSKLWFSVNGAWLGSGVPSSGTNPAFSSSNGITTSKSYVPVLACCGNQVSGNNVWACNFGQRPFAYGAPAGFSALCTANLPQPTIQKPSTAMDVVTYTGNGTSPRTISGFGFSPDFLWVKNRTDAYNHIVYDTVRGAGSDKGLSTNTTKEENNTDNTNYGYVSAFTSDGFSVTTGAIDFGLANTNSKNYVAWSWDAGSTTSTNNSGSITSTVRVNPQAGFSIVSYTGTGANATVGHGLGVAPKMVILKRRDAGSSPWMVWHSGLSGGTYYLVLSGTGGQAVGATRFTASPTSSVVNIGTDGDLNASSGTYIAYCFAEIEGYSKFGSYTGNGSADGPFVWCGFRPRWVMVKRTDVANSWLILDSARNTYNYSDSILWADLSDAQTSGGTTTSIDFISNGFKTRGTGASINTSSGTYIFAAFAEAPFKYARAR